MQKEQMMKKKIAIITIGLALLLITVASYQKYQQSPRAIPTFGERPEPEILTIEQYIEDFEYAYDILEAHYPYFKVNEIKTGVDWLEQKEKYLEQLSNVTVDGQFTSTMQGILDELHNDHVRLMPAEEGLMFYTSYMTQPRYTWTSKAAEVFEKPTVRARYPITNERIDEYLSLTRNLEEMGEQTNLKAYDLVPGQVGYFSIASMLPYDPKSTRVQAEKEYLLPYLQSVKDYPALVIDIRDNYGGDSAYWANFILPMILDEEASRTAYLFQKDAPLFEHMIRQHNMQELSEDFIKSLNVNPQAEEIVSDFDYYTRWEHNIKPNADSIGFNGNIYLLVNSRVYSSSETFASFAKESGIATLIGTTTGGDGLASGLTIFDLPNTGYLIQFTSELGMTESGSISELDQTTPHYEASPIKPLDSNGEINIERDRTIQKVLELEGLELD